MTRDEFMAKAREEIDRAFMGHRNRMMNLVEQAWAEGKRNAELDAVTDIVRQALDRMHPVYPDPVQPWVYPTITCNAAVNKEEVIEDAQRDLPGRGRGVCDGSDGNGGRR